MTVPIVIDCDPGNDDAIALLLALASPEVELLGVTTVAGNQTLEKTTANALHVFDLAGRDEIPVAAGAEGPLAGGLVVAADAHGESGLGNWTVPPPHRRPLEQHAIDFLAARVLESDTPVTLVATGPLTNVALFLDRHHDAAAKLGRIVLMGGAVGVGNMTASAEYNVWVDPEAAAQVFESGLDVTMVGLDVTNRALLADEHADVLRRSGPIGRAVAELLDFYRGFYSETYDFGGCPVHDAVAVAHVVRPDLLTTVDRHVAVELDGALCRGRTVVDMRLRRSLPTPNAHVAVDIDAPSFVELLLERLSAPALQNVVRSS